MGAVSQVPRMIRCRFCDWEVLALYKGTSGQWKSGFSKLDDHMEDNHFAEWEANKLAAAAASREGENTL